MARDRLRFEIPSAEREKDAWEYLEEFEREGVHPCGIGHLCAYRDNYLGWLAKLEADSEPSFLEPDKVITETFFLVRERDKKIVGMFNIRLDLNEKFWNEGGNIGYSIRKSERRKGYAKVGLFLAIEECCYHEMEAVVLSCQRDNEASKRTIKSLGGKIDSGILEREVRKFAADVCD